MGKTVAAETVAKSESVNREELLRSDSLSHVFASQQNISFYIKYLIVTPPCFLINTVILKTKFLGKLLRCVVARHAIVCKCLCVTVNKSIV